MRIILRSEEERDYEQITDVNNQAFKQKNESILIQRLRKKKSYIQQLSIVAIKETEIIGHVLFYPIRIKTTKQDVKTISLGPVAVIPKYQGKGIGKKLIRKGIEKSKEIGFKSIIVIGHPRYYPNFGFKKAENYNIKLQEKYKKQVKKEAFMILELEKDSLKNVEGIVIYPEEFDDAM